MTPNKQTLTLKPLNRGPFGCMPARDIELDADRILCNDVILPGEFNPHNVRLWVIGNEFGALCAVWATEHEALDVAVDESTFLDCHKVKYPTAEELEAEDDDRTYLGNASELFDLTYVWMQEVNLTPELIAKFRIAADECYTSLDQVPA